MDFKRRAAAVIGIAGAIGAFGGFLIQVAFRQASLDVAAAVKAAATPAEKLAVAQANADWSVPALWVFLGAYVVLGAADLVLLPAPRAGDEPRAEPGARLDLRTLPPPPGTWSAQQVVDRPVHDLVRVGASVMPSKPKPR